MEYLQLPVSHHGLSADRLCKAQTLVMWDGQDPCGMQTLQAEEVVPRAKDDAWRRHQCASILNCPHHNMPLTVVQSPSPQPREQPHNDLFLAHMCTHLCNLLSTSTFEHAQMFAVPRAQDNGWRRNQRVSMVTGPHHTYLHMLRSSSTPLPFLIQPLPLHPPQPLCDSHVSQPPRISSQTAPDRVLTHITAEPWPQASHRQSP